MHRQHLLGAIGIAAATLVVGAAVHAGSLEDGQAAHQRKDYAAALALLEPLAKAGNPHAECEVATLYEEGMGGKAPGVTDPDAVKWFRRAADHGNAQAQAAMGFIYLAKAGSQEDYDQPAHTADDLAQSVTWFRKAGEQGHGRALWREALAYQTGLGGPDGLGGADRLHSLGVARDYARAYALYSLAAQTGNEGMVAQRDALAAKLTPEQLAEGRRQTEAWRAGHPAPYWSDAC